MVEFDVVWRRIGQHAGEVFTQRRGGEFTYEVTRALVRLHRTNQVVAKSQFHRAFERLPVAGPGALQDLRAPSYLFAILTDDRITG